MKRTISLSLVILAGMYFATTGFQ
ncbi:MAG: hypothetical protein H6Q31_1591, partial [Bacteroidetes bacterium]|nr:hypothetical protein [Bacteroidota bacterium]